MAKAKKASEERPTFGRKESRPSPKLGLLILVLAILALISLWDYSWLQNPDMTTDVVGQNKVGDLGLNVAYYSLRFLGAAAWLLPASLAWIAAMLFLAQGRKLTLGRFSALLGVVISLPVLLAMVETHRLAGGWERTDNYRNDYVNGLGGWVGQQLYGGILHESLGELGTLVVFGVLFAAALVYVLYDNLGSAIGGVLGHMGDWNRSRREALAARREEEKRKAAMRQATAKANASVRAADPVATPAKPATAKAPAPDTAPAEDPTKGKGGLLGRFSRAIEKAPAPQARLLDETEASMPTPVPLPARVDAPPPPKTAKTAKDEDDAPAVPLKLPARVVDPSPQDAAPAPGSLKIIMGEVTRKVTVAQPAAKGDYIFPSLSLLKEPQDVPPEATEEYHQQTADQLVRTLGEFGVKVTMGEVHIGPVITRYDVYPAAGVRVEKIQNLDKNLALSLKALSVRILAPVPGKGCVGVEIPNKHAQSVFIRDILESENWVNSKAEIPIALGKEVSGKPLVTDLTKMPHLLIAGSTGAGKTVCINAVVASLLYKLSPQDVRFVMVDPKIVEMQVYNALPHMLIPVVTDPKKVPGALKYLLNEMERRYHLFASVGVRNIAGYNAKRAADSKDAAAKAEADAKAREMDASLSPEERAAAADASLSVPRQLDFTEEEAPVKLPYIVAIVDELADLMMVAPADIETGIARLAQLARAAGIHLILATQRPSVNVITGVIKANLPSRISFKVASKVDSRTILDAGGADQLIGRGDMLFLPPGSADLVRSQGAFVADEEINAIVEFVSRNNGEPEFDEQFQRTVEESTTDGEGADEEEEDESGDSMLADALEVIRTSKRASTSMLQRRLRIGYNRAARIMEILEERGYVGPENGSQPREILKELE